jgi:hypothetical protein
MIAVLYAELFRGTVRTSWGCFGVWKRSEASPTSDVLESLTELRLDIHPKSSCSLKQYKMLETISKQKLNVKLCNVVKEQI